MRFRNSFRLLISNFKHVYALLLFRLVVFLVTGALGGLVLAAGFGFLIESAEAAELIEAAKKILDSFFAGTNYETFDAMLRSAIDGVAYAFGNVLLLLTRNIGNIVLSALALVLLAVAGRFMNGLALFSFGDMLNDRMSQYTDTPFFLGFFHNLPQAALYQIVYVPLAFVYDVLTVVICYFVFFQAFHFIPVLLSLFFGVTFLVVAQALKLTCISDWMPAIIAGGKKMTQAMKESFSFRQKRFSGYFSDFLVAVYCILVVNVVCAVASFGSALLLTLPGSYAFLICMQFVHYYDKCGKRYFLSYRSIGGEREEEFVAAEESKRDNQ